MIHNVQHLLEVKGTDVWTISPEASVYDALRMMAAKDIGALIVVEGSKVIGILSERDYARKIILQGKTSKETKVSEIMSTKLIVVHPLQTVDEAMQLMNSHHIRHLPVMVDDHCEGVISINDVVGNILFRQRETIKRLSSDPSRQI